MRIVTFGFQTWGHRTLQAIIGSKHEVVLAVTHPPSDNPYEQMWNDSVEELAIANGIPVHIAKRPDAELRRVVDEAAPDLIVANNWRTWLPEEIWRKPRLGTLNVHDSLLPKYAGFSPLIWALINGEPQVGVTAHMMDERLDAGPIVAQVAVPVGAQDRTVDLFRRTVDEIEPLLLHALDLLESDTAQLIPQDPAAATYFHKRSARDSHIDFSWPAEVIERLVRAQSDPYPNAFCYFKGERLRVLSASVSATRYGGTPGRITVEDAGGIAVTAGPQAWSGANRALVLHRLRTDDGVEHDALTYLGNSGGYLE
ncbi:methionyl-tRNA formyltransferase [Nocardia sp. NPDC051321]|uniref:methionyl-tRNA formyltransferase n=1 Tax=Nocardia sp. NPDC051321 TaxID=3364323 RepID=UPI00378E381F